MRGRSSVGQRCSCTGTHAAAGCRLFVQSLLLGLNQTVLLYAAECRAAVEGSACCQHVRQVQGEQGASWLCCGAVCFHSGMVTLLFQNCSLRSFALLRFGWQAYAVTACRGLLLDRAGKMCATPSTWTPSRWSKQRLTAYRSGCGEAYCRASPSWSARQSTSLRCAAGLLWDSRKCQVAALPQRRFFERLALVKTTLAIYLHGSSEALC